MNTSKPALDILLWLVTAVIVLTALSRLHPELELVKKIATPKPGLQPVNASSSQQLAELFQEHGYSWPPAGPVPALAVESLPEDFESQTVPERKSLFFRALAPLIAAENQQLLRDREFLQTVFAAHEHLPRDAGFYARIDRLAQRYRVKGDLDEHAVRAQLLRRVDIVPAPLVLAQAANESAWGTSRFAQQANNLFGMWTWDANQGIAPQERAVDANHYVRVFDSLREAVRNYMYTINSGHAYASLRVEREKMRNSGQTLDALALAKGLARYSSRGDAYVEEIRSIIRYNSLHEFPRFELRKPQAVTGSQ